ncbi:MAG TPA: type II toxin-antitoxin system death-on-curing family toxin [Tepidisphaeraceae bacterium]|nr:type II toxin-antitoxin system death-on-curing family toxin [Tepidisphaeraceae bacterium]
MRTPRFLSVERVLALHRLQLEKFGGQEGVRDQALLESAVAMPAASFGGQFVHAGLAEMAAAYLFHINRNHPFLDGNKRTATAAAVVFLELNGVDFVASNEELTAIALAVASGTADKAAAADFFRRHIPPTQD